MIKEIIDANNSKEPGSNELEVLREHFPACFKEDGSFDIIRFQEYLKDKVEVTDEGYELRFLGKNYARMLASLDTTTVIVPDEAHNSLPENKDSKNIYISGDNLDALKHLLKSYAGQIKCIYIDPPYNTGSDGFVYNDNFNFTAEELSTKLSITVEKAQRILDLTRRGSASHSAWLMFMLPRLLLARDLLSKDGIIFISIDDNEQGNLKLLCDDIFGEENLLAQIIVQANKRGQTYKQLAKTHEYLLVYSRTEVAIVRELLKEISGNTKIDSVGEYTERELRNRNPKYGRFNRPNLFYPVFINPNVIDENGYSPVSLEQGIEFPIEVLPYNSEGQESCWRWGKNKFSENNDSDSLLSNVVARKKNTGEYGIYEKYRKETYKSKTIWTEIEIIDDEDDEDSIDTLIWDETGVITEQGTTELKKYGMGDVFDFPKPTYLIKKILSIGSDLDSICLDFFSGSGTLADAVMQLNAIRGCRKFIAVQLPVNMQTKYNETSQSEKQKIKKVIDFLEQNNYPLTLNYIGLERIKRAATKIKADNPLFHGDLGFRHFTLKEPSGIALEKIIKFDKNTAFGDNTLVDEFGVPTILTTWLERDGYGLTSDYQVLDLGSYEAYYIDKHLYLINPNLSDDAVSLLLEKYQTEASFNPQNVVIYSYSFGWNELQSLKDSLQTVQSGEKNLHINFGIRY
ncbi:site-specific DNA-methyltransferase [Bacteroides acidifaciens]|uniref:site-specific DNA-methyltransferase n=1 Tax=Bacteroides acidifaciens TaxID=85831 RepID=UPI002557F6DF|nr:site-specific DNA-methyltransferase [Bacteroides acidifaciens]